MAKCVKKFVLIWWIEDCKTDIYPLGAIPKSKQRVGAETMLSWRDAKTLKHQQCKAKILAIGETESELERVMVTKEGVINNECDKIYSQETLDEQSILRKKRITAQKCLKTSKRKTEEEIKKIAPLKFKQAKFQNECVDLSRKFPSCIQPISSNPNSSYAQDSNNCSVNYPVPYNPVPIPFNPSALNYSETYNPSFHQNQEFFPSNSIERSKTEKSISVEKNIILDELDDNESSVSSLDNDDIIASDDTSSDHGIGVLAGISIGRITERDIFIQEQVLNAMKRSFENQKRMDQQSQQLIKIPEHHFESGEAREELAPHCGFYLPKHLKAVIELAAQRNKSWKILVRETILHVYGSTIINYSTTGKRTSRPPIDFKLFNGLLEWVNEKFPPVDQKQLTTYISKIAANKRKYLKLKKTMPKTSKKNRAEEQDIKGEKRRVEIEQQDQHHENEEDAEEANL